MGLRDTGHPSRATFQSLTQFSRHARFNVSLEVTPLCNPAMPMQAQENNHATVFPAPSVGQEEGGYCSSPQTPYGILGCANTFRILFPHSLHTGLYPSYGDQSLIPQQGLLLLYFQVHRSAFCLLSLVEKRMGTVFSSCLPHLFTCLRLAASQLFLCTCLSGLCVPNVTGPWLPKADF